MSSGKNAKKDDTFVLADEANYIDYSAALVTHSVKESNSKVEQMGIRVVPKHDVTFPYACVSTSKQKIKYNYYTKIKNFYKLPDKIHQQVMALDKEDFSNFSDKTKARAYSASVRAILNSYLNNFKNTVSPRLPKIIIQTATGEDLCVTPLHSSGLSDKISHLIQEWIDRYFSSHTEERLYLTISLMYLVYGGGKNSHNLGYPPLLSKLNEARVFPVPSENIPGLKKAFALYYNGPQLQLDKNLLRSYEAFRLELRSQALRQHQRDTIIRQHGAVMREKEILGNIIAPILQQAEKDREYLHRFQSFLPGVCDPSLPLSKKGLLQPDLRTPEWKQELATVIAQKMITATDKSGSRIISLASDNLSALVAHLKDLLP